MLHFDIIKLILLQMLLRLLLKLYSHELKYLVTTSTAVRSHDLPVKLMLYCFCWHLTGVKWRSQIFTPWNKVKSLCFNHNSVMKCWCTSWPWFLSGCQRRRHRWRSHRPAAEEWSRFRSWVDELAGAQSCIPKLQHQHQSERIHQMWH